MLDQTIAENEHFEFFWRPGHDACLMKTLNKTDDPEDFEKSKGDYRSETFERERIGHWDEILPSQRNNRFNEMEFSVPAWQRPKLPRRAARNDETKNTRRSPGRWSIGPLRPTIFHSALTLAGPP